MKTGTYKKVNGKVEKISNKVNKLEVKTDLDHLMLAYDGLFKLIDSGSNVVNFVKTREYKEGLLDSLQVVMVQLLENKKYIDHKNITGLLRKAFYDRTIDLIRYENTYEIFGASFLSLTCFPFYSIYYLIVRHKLEII